MTRTGITVHKNRRKRKKTSNYDDKTGMSAAIAQTFSKYTTKQPKRRKRNLRLVHPSPVEIGITPSQVDGPGFGPHSTAKHWVVLRRFFVPLSIALILGFMFKPTRSEFGAKTPFEEGETYGSVVTFNPKSTGIEYERKMDYVNVRSNITYARMFTKWNLGEFQYRNYQWIYIYAILGRDVSNINIENGTYTYMQHLKTSLSAFTFDKLGEVVLVDEVEVTKRVSCSNLRKWCRKIPVAVVSEINYPKYELTVRFSRPPSNVGEKNYWNSTIPILGKVTYEYVSISWLSFEIIVRYGLNMMSGAVFFWPRVGLWPSLCERPVEDFTASRCFGVLLFVVLFFFNEPFFIFQVFIPDAQNIFRAFAALCTTLAAAVYLGFITHVFFHGKFTDPRPPSLVIWVESSKRQMAKEEEERKIQAAQAASSLPSGIVLPPKPTKNIQRAQRTADKIIKTPMFFMSTAKFMNYDDESEEEDEEAQEAKKRLTKKELRELKARNRKSRGVRIAEDGYVMFYTEFRAQVCHGMTQLLSDERGGNNWRTVWRDIVGPILMLVCVILVWITAFNLYMTQMNDGPTPRPRLTLSFAMDKHEAEATPMVVAVGLQAALMIGCFAYAGRELSLSVTAYICFLAVSGLTGMFVMLYTLNCSFYTLGTPFIEVITSRTLFNCYAWVVSFMIRPLETVGGRFPKRNNDTAASSSESDYDDDEDEEEEEEEEVKVDTKKTSALTIPSMTGVMPEEEDDSDKQSDDSEEEEEEEEEEGEEEEEDEEEETRDGEEAEESTKDDETESV